MHLFIANLKISGDGGERLWDLISENNELLTRTGSRLVETPLRQHGDT
jgi:hypothetical protein